ncbi:pseudaminic acid cytidylyltransferase [Kineothrix sp. MB12-C1]|nr:pseudaminic acid cytidylyltransferase [Kineothrix sp. MB12-C1]WMC94492.1 pseudaminic acid cytidylyltransferase [Kineothrix sp. MB12-C1]
MQLEAIAIITARGGSKRIPGKNIKEFLGKPIICYSIEAALSSGLFDEVMVSTDDEAIAEMAKKAGASVPFMRSVENSDDFATTDDVLMEVLEEYEKRGTTFHYMACIYPTAPFVTPQKLKSALRLLKENKASGVMPVVSFSFPPQRGMAVRKGRLEYCYPENAKMRSQDLETIYHDCGQFYFYDTDKYRACRGDLEEGYVPIVVPETEVQDIDNPSDFRLAEIKYLMMEEGEKGDGKED